MRKAYYRWIPAYFDLTTNKLMGRNGFYDILLNISIWIDLNILNVEEIPVWFEED